VRGADVCSNGTVDGVHDQGGMQGFGSVDQVGEEPVFHSDWERRAFRVTVAAMMSGRLSGRFRHAIERMDPVWYLESPYYEHWLTATATGLLEGGLLTQAELDERLGAPFPVARPMRAPRLVEPGPSSNLRRYALGARVRVREWHPLGHTRAPRYVQGKPGTIVRLDGVFSLPDVEYHCDAKRLEPTYSVRFAAHDLWGEPGDPVHVDVWESYLEAEEKRP
jgi:nitrile hydratase beta subunit